MPGAETCLKVMKAFNIIVALLIVTAGVLGIISIAQYLVGAKFFLVFSPVFITLFGLLMLAAEFRVKFILNNFSFLDSLMGKGIFNIFISTIVFYFFAYSNSDVLAWCISMVLFSVGVTYMILHCCCRDKAESDLNKTLNS